VRPTFEDEWRERFTEFAEQSEDEAGIAGWSATGLEARVRRFRALWRPLRPGGLWLDAGCGAGTYLRILSEGGQRAVGADYSLPALNKRPPDVRAVADVVVADVRALPFRDEVFDGVLCLGVLQALSESDAAVREVVRPLKPGGEVWIDALNARFLVHVVERLRVRMKRRPVHLRHESPGRVRRLLEQQGLVDVTLHWIPIAPARQRWLQRLFDSAAFVRLARAVPLLGGLLSHAFVVHARRPL
jgi:ubiquinone/menaquinone biosynthesis C-methylase UbiE